MKTTLTFITRELVSYSQSSTTKEILFYSLKEACEFAINQRKAHPRSNKLNEKIYIYSQKDGISKFVNDVNASFYLFIKNKLKTDPKDAKKIITIYGFRIKDFK